MKIARVTFLSVRGLPDRTWDLAKPTGVPHEVAVVTGPPGSGKTRVLEAIVAAKEVLAPYGPPPDPAAWIRPGERSAKIELTFFLDEDERRRAGNPPALAKGEALFGPPGVKAEIDDGVADVLEHYEHDARSGKMDYVPATRAIPLFGAPQGLTAFEQRIHRLPRDPDKFAFVPRLLIELAHDEVSRARFEAALAKLCPSLSFLGRTAAQPLGAFSSRGGPPLSTHELSTHESEAVMFAATETLIHLDRSVLLVDRPENATDERHADTFLAALGTLAGGLQILCASASPTLLRSVDPGAILDLGA